MVASAAVAACSGSASNGGISPTRSGGAPSTSNSGPASGSSTLAPTGEVTVDIVTPNGIPANVTLVKGDHKALFTKSADGTSRSVGMRLSPGHYCQGQRIRCSDGALYDSSARGSVTVSAGRSDTVTVTFRAVPSASTLHATKVTTTNISLAWSAPIGAAFSLRRTADSSPVATRQGGAAVRVSGLTALDTGLKAGHRYSYALFTRLKAAGPVRSPCSPERPRYRAARPLPTSPRLARCWPRTPRFILPSRLGLACGSRSRRASRCLVLGTAIVLPVLGTLPGGFVGLVSGISAGGCLTLTPAGLSAAFQYLDLNIDNITVPAVRLTPPAAARSKGTSSPHPPKGSCLGVHSWAPLRSARPCGSAAPSTPRSTPPASCTSPRARH